MHAARLRELSLSLPGATETIQWGDNRVFKVGGKMFAVSGFEDDSLTKKLQREIMEASKRA